MFSPEIQRVIDRVDRLRNEVDDHWQIPAEEGRLLAQLVRLAGSKSICEIGTSYGFSTLHLAAAAARHEGVVHTFDIDDRKVVAAREYVQDAGLGKFVFFHCGRAQDLIGSIELNAPFDFVFIDAWKSESETYLDAVLQRIGKRCVLVTDNTDTHADQLNDFVKRLRNLEGAISCNISVGNGIELTILDGVV